jgi:hypothetical protein
MQILSKCLNIYDIWYILCPSIKLTCSEVTTVTKCRLPTVHRWDADKSVFYNKKDLPYLAAATGRHSFLSSW